MFENRRYFYTDLHEDLIYYLREKGTFNLVASSDYVFRVIDGETFYLKNRSGNGHQYTEEELVVLRLRATKL